MWQWRVRMRRKKENVRYHVVSVRVSHEDRETLEHLSKQTNMKVSDLMREALLAVPAKDRS